MLRFCSDGHPTIIFQGEEEDCPLCETGELLAQKIVEYELLKKKIIEKTHNKGIDFDKLELDL